MSQDTKYRSYPLLFVSKGIFAHYSIDRPPSPEGFYLNLDGVETREESTISSRYGSIIINRDPAGTGTSNYFFPGPPNSISKLINGSSVYRYVGVGPYGINPGSLWRRSSITQGTFTQLSPTGLYGGPAFISGSYFSTIITPCYQSAQPYLFIADPNVMLKESGTGNPVSWGILGPLQVVNTKPYGLGLQTTAIEPFQSATGFTTTGFTISGLGTIGVANGTGGVNSGLGYEIYNCSDGSSALAQDGSLGVSTATGDFLIKFNTSQDTTKFDMNLFLGSFVATDSFTFKTLNGTVAANSTGSIGKTTGSVATYASSMTPDDLFILVIQVGSPESVQEIRLQFDVAGSGYTSSYYYKSITPATFQTGVSSPQTTSPSQAVTNEVSGRAGGTVNQNTFGISTLPSGTQAVIAAEPLPIGDPVVPRLQPVALTTGASSWSVIYIRKGDFVPVGNAGAPGLDWSAITGWQVQVITNTQGSTTIGLNAFYSQSGAGPSSYGGVGYDYRYTYFDAVTNTESNPCAAQYYEVTPINPAGISTLIVLRQAIQVTGQYSSNSRVTHVRIYRRGGVLPGPAWLLVDQITNTTGTGTFSYKDIYSDEQIAEASQLNLANDPPVTSTLQNPIVTTLTAALNPTAPFTPITVSVASSTAVFVVGQIVNIGNASDLEQVIVATGGVGTFTACVQLPHASGEPVQVFAQPAIPVNLCALAYNQVWLAGDLNNPHILYYSNPGFPENFPPQNYIPVSNPSDPIQAVINFRGTLFVATKATWYQIYPSNPPVAQPTGSKHGLAFQQAWTQTESAIIYQAFDGIRMFNGADGAYISGMIEWLFQNQPTSPSPSPVVAFNQAALANPNLGQTLMAYWNNRIFISYLGTDNNRHRLIYDLVFNRWHNDDLYVNGMFYEEDTNFLMIGRVNQAGAAQGSGNYVLAQDQVGDYDDQGWSGGVLVQQAISFLCQTPYYDQNQYNNEKQYNMFTVDANPRGQVLTLKLLFNDPASSIPVVTFPTFTGTKRQKFQFILNSGDGQQAYRVSAQLLGAVTTTPVIYQMEVFAAELAAQTASYDTYWIKFGTDESKLVKQGYFDYTSTSLITVNLYADGNTMPYFTFTLPANPARSESPTRIRFPVAKLRQFRLVATTSTSGMMQFWAAPQIDIKPVISGKGYERKELQQS